MKGYVLTVAGAVLLSAVLHLVLPSGKMGKFLKGMTKLFLLGVLVAPVLSLFQNKEFSLSKSTLNLDEPYLDYCTEEMEESDKERISDLLEEKFQIRAEVDAERGQDFTLRKITVKILDSGIFGQEEHIDIVKQVQALLEETFGCAAEVSCPS